MGQVVKRGIPFEVRDGTVDINVLEEVVDADCYRLEAINLREHPNIVDVGAHIGSFSKLAAWRWPHARIYAYEANPRNWPILERNLEAIKHKVTIFKGALVGSEPANKRLVINPDEADRVTGGWGIIYSDDTYEPEDQRGAIDIENFFYIKDLFPVLNKIDVLKLDCEGSEFSIIKHMGDDELHKVDYLVAEIHCGALPHAPISWAEFRHKILKHFICPDLEARQTVNNSDLFNIVACNRKLLPS